jgi:ribosome-dependent ATPase
MTNTQGERAPAGAFWSSTRAVAGKELVHVRRDPATRFVFMIPLIQLALFGYAINLEVKDIPTAFVDLDNSPESRQLLSSFDQTKTFTLTERHESLEAMQEAIVAGRARVGVYVPHGMGRKIDRGERAEALVLVDGSYASEASAAVSSAQAIGQFSSAHLGNVHLAERTLKQATPGSGRAVIEPKGRLLFNPALKSATFFVPGLVGIILQLVTLLLTSFAIVREKEQGTLEQLLVTPLSPWGLMVGKLLPYLGIGAVQTAAVLALMVWVFDVPIVGNIALLSALSLLFLLTSLSLGVLISTWARSQTEAMQMALLMLLPSILLSGFVFPLASIPEPLRPLTYVIPVRYYIEVLRAVIVRGAPLDALWFEAGAMAAFTVALLMVSAARFRRFVK